MTLGISPNDLTETEFNKHCMRYHSEAGTPSFNLLTSLTAEILHFTIHPPACPPACFLLYFYKLKELILLASGPRRVFPYNVLYTFLVFQVAKFLLGSVVPCGKGGTTATVRYGYSLALLYHRNHERHVWKRELKGQMEMKGVASNLHNVCILMSQRAESTGVVWWCGIKVKSHGTVGTWTTPALILTTGSYMALNTDTSVAQEVLKRPFFRAWVYLSFDNVLGPCQT